MQFNFRFLIFPTCLQVTDFPAYIREVAAPYLNITHPIQYDFLPRVYVHAHHIPENQFPGLYKAANALVQPTHGEGWGRCVYISYSVWVCLGALLVLVCAVILLCVLCLYWYLLLLCLGGC